MRKHGKMWNSRVKLNEKIASIVFPGSHRTHHELRTLSNINNTLDEAGNISVKREEYQSRVRLRQLTKGWLDAPCYLLSTFLQDHLEKRQNKVYKKIRKLTGCSGWQLILANDTCVSVLILRGCSSFPGQPSRHRTFHPWESPVENSSMKKAEDWIDVEILQPAKERLTTEKPPDPFVNLSGHVLSDEAVDLLNRGLSFVPTKSRPDDFEVDIGDFLNKLGWLQYWEENEKKSKLPPEVEERLLKWKTKFERTKRSAPMPNPATAVGVLYKQAEELLKYENVLVPNPPKLNCPSKALREVEALASDENFVFLEADKGAGLILMKREEYREKIYRDVLNDRVTYEELKSDPSEQLEKDFKQLLSDLKREEVLIPQEEQKIVRDKPRLPRMFGLPKLHKPGHPMRPVVSCVNSVLDKSGNLIDNVVKPVVASGWQYLQDSTHVLKYVEERKAELRREGFQESQIYLVSFDVESFYPSVPHERAVEAFQRAKKDLKVEEEQAESISRILKLHLSNAFFSFGDKFFRQKTGLPIGSSIGGPIACLALALAEDQLLERLKRTNPKLATIFKYYRRYLDDSLLMFGCMSPSEAKDIAQTILELLNEMDRAFRFTTTGATQDLVVLDIRIVVEHGRLVTKNYQKPTDKRTLLNSTSDHPQHVKRAIAYGVGLRGHRPEWIRHGFARAALKPRALCLEKSEKEKTTKKQVCLISY